MSQFSSFHKEHHLCTSSVPPYMCGWASNGLAAWQSHGDPCCLPSMGKHDLELGGCWESRWCCLNQPQWKDLVGNLLCFSQSLFIFNLNFVVSNVSKNLKQKWSMFDRERKQQGRENNIWMASGLNEVKTSMDAVVYNLLPVNMVIFLQVGVKMKTGGEGVFSKWISEIWGWLALCSTTQ